MPGANDTTISVTFKGNADDLKKTINDINGELNGFEKKTESSTSKSVFLGNVAARAFSMVAQKGTELLKSGVEYNAAIEQYKTSFEVMTGSAEVAEKTMSNLIDMGAKTPFETKDLANTTQLLINYGLGAKEAVDSLSMLGDISQGSAEKLGSISLAYGQMHSLGKVQLQDIKQMINGGFNPLQEISETTGESMESLYDRISKGTLSVDEITQSMIRSTSEGGKYFQSMEKQSQTVSGLMSTMKDNASQLFGTLASGTSQTMTSILPQINNGLGNMATAFQEKGVAGLVSAGFDMVMALVNSIIVSLPNILQTGIDIIIALMNGLTQQGPSLISTFADVIVKLVDTITKPDNLNNIILGAISLILALANGLIDAMPTLIEAMPIIIMNIVSALIQLLPQIIPVALALLTTFGKALITSHILRDKFLPMLITSIFKPFIDTDWSTLGKNIIDGLVNGIKNSINALKDTVKNVANSVSDTFKNVLGIHSPSTLFFEFGYYTDKGYANGLIKNADLIEKAYKKINLIPPNFNDTSSYSSNLFNSVDISSSNESFVDAVKGVGVDIANGIENGLRQAKFLPNNREAGRWIADLGFARA